MKSLTKPLKMLLGLNLFLGLLGTTAAAAPYYTGIGCNEQGQSCIFGTPSKQVLRWFEIGTVQNLGERCEKFYLKIENRKQKIGAQLGADFQMNYRNFTYGWVNEIQEDGRALIRCSIELHSENPRYEVTAQLVKNFYWVCEDNETSGICAHKRSECINAAKEAEQDDLVLTSTTWDGASLLQGTICEAVTAKITDTAKKEQVEEKKGKSIEVSN